MLAKKMNLLNLNEAE
jgi:serine/threonine kinase 38